MKRKYLNKLRVLSLGQLLLLLENKDQILNGSSPCRPSHASESSYKMDPNGRLPSVSDS